MIRLEVEVGEVRGRATERDAAEITLGRAPSSDLLLPDWHISGSHGVLRVLPESGAVRYRDLRSTNGSRVRRGSALLPVDGSVEFEQELQPGDRLELGDPQHAVVVKVSFTPTAAKGPFLPPTASALSATMPGGEGAARGVLRGSTQVEVDPEAHVVAQRAVADVGEARQQVERDPVSFKTVLAALQKLSGALELDEVLDAVADAVFEVVPRATHLTVHLRDESVEKPTYVPVTTRVRGATGIPAEPVPVTRSVVRKVIEQRAAVLAADAMREVGESASIMGAKILSTMGVPLWKGEDIPGILQVDNRASAGIFKERDLDLLMVVAQQAGLALANARLYQRVKLAEASARSENSFLKQRAQKKFERMIGDSSAMRQLFEKLSKVIDTRVTVLIEGETGTGKELVASTIHYQSRRKEKLFIAQNCAALPETLLESELFGHKKGAFTGATEDKKGLFDLADGGTLFLDEIGEMPLGLQAKILRVLQEGEVRPLGSGVTRTVDVRIVAATNRKLEDEVAAGRFRQDLYYRLQVFPVRIPPLRERREDIPILANHFLKRYAHEMGKAIHGFSQQTLELMMSYNWPGNVRELENEVQRLVIQSDPGGYVMAEHLSPRIRNIEGILDKIRPPRGTLKDMIEHIEKWLLIEALREHGNNKSATAKTLGITREGLHKKLKSYGIS
ncbi:MAG: sigma 54-interacting transcriptional regulator [Myxococcales bacterium]|nr:sigma 54-interacting transcriptional regulator [Myxococcales bacterium]